MEREREREKERERERGRVFTLHRVIGGSAAAAALAYDPGAGAADSKRALILVTAAAAMSLSIGRLVRSAGPRRLRVSPAGALWVGFVAWGAVTLAWGAKAGVTTLGTWVGAAGLLAAAMVLPREEAMRAARLAGAVTGGGSAAAAIAQYAAGARGLAVHGGHGNPNWLGLLLSMTLPLSIDLAIELRRAKARSWPLAAVGAAIQVPALILSHSRVAWAAAVLALAVWAAASRAWRGARGVAAGVVAAALVAFAAPASADATREAEAEAEGALGAVDTSIATAWEGRVWIWRASADAAVRALPLGEGLGGFPEAYLDAQGARLAPLEPKVASRKFMNATTAHSDWIEVAVACGIPGLALLFSAIAWGFVGLLRGGDASGPWFAGAASLVAFAVCAAGDSPMHQPGALLPIALVLGAAPRIWRGLPRARSILAMGILLSGAAILLATSVGSWLCVRRLSRARDGLPEDRIPLLASAARLDPRSGEAALALGLAHLELERTRDALRELERSRALLANIGTDVAIGNAHLNAGSPERAASAYARALARHPGYFRARANITEALTQLGRLDEAAAHLAIARSLFPGHPKLAAIAERLRQARLDAATSAPPPP